jgi:pyruvate dehydrogenase E2 component (dihydrolipoamide acetyltransferase)
LVSRAENAVEKFEFRLPDLAEGLTEAAIRSVLVADGDHITEDTPIFEVETDKATVEISSPVTGRVSSISVQPGDTAAVGELLITFELENAQPPTLALARGASATPGGSAVGGEELHLPDFERCGPVERRAMSRARRTTAERMSLAARLIPHVTHFDRIDITDIMSAIRGYRADIPKGGVIPTLTSFLVRAAALALARHSQFNASVDMSAGEIIIKQYRNIGIAMQTPRGLLVPVIRDVATKSVASIAKELAPLTVSLRKGASIPMEYFEGGTFTVTNVGTIRGTGNIPIINYPEVAILGVSQAREEPVVRGGRIVPRLQLPISMTFDHRVADGIEAAGFAADIAGLLEEPDSLLAEAGAESQS